MAQQSANQWEDTRRNALLSSLVGTENSPDLEGTAKAVDRDDDRVIDPTHEGFCASRTLSIWFTAGNAAAEHSGSALDAVEGSAGVC